jgi:predicted  nucleic acid-binding Zn-ribbon protein
MAVNKRPGQKQEVDLEATDELPALELADSPEAQINTDIFPAPVIPAGMADLADSLRDVETRLQRKSERVHQLEAELAAAAESLRQLNDRTQQQEAAAAARETALQAQVADLQQQLTALQAEGAARQNELQDARRELAEQRAALNDARQQLAQRTGERAWQEQDLAEWRRRTERQHEALCTWQGFRSISEALLGESEQALYNVETGHAAQLAAVQARVTAVESDLAAARAESARRIAALEAAAQRAEELQQSTAGELSAAKDGIAVLTADLAAREASIAELQSQLAELRAIEEKARRGAAVHDEQMQQIASLEEELEEAQHSGGEIAQQLRAALERIQRLETEAHAGAALLGNLQQNIERLGRDDTGARPVVKEPPVEVGLRVLIRQEGGANVVYPLGKRTTIGRTSENDIQIDTSYVSRHHAVLLSSGDRCIVEDLHSTNGVLVNGRRVGRQILQDGDTVTVGKTEFKYQQRS